MSSISQYYGIVLSVLRTYPSARDSDAVLFYRVLESAGHDPKTMTVAEFLKLLHTNSAPSLEVISRIRRKIQEDVVDTRGQQYERRRDQEVNFVTSLVTEGRSVTEHVAKMLNTIQEQLSLEPLP